MSKKSIGAAQFKAGCLRVIDQMQSDGEAVTITKRGRPVAVLQPVKAEDGLSIIGVLRGSVHRYDEPFAPAAAPADWNATE